MGVRTWEILPQEKSIYAARKQRNQLSLNEPGHFLEGRFFFIKIYSCDLAVIIAWEIISSPGIENKKNPALSSAVPPSNIVTVG